MRMTALALPVVAATALLLAGCAPTPPPTSWVSKSGSQAVFLDWTDSNGTINGTAQVASAQPSSASEPVKVTSVAVSGTEAGGKVTLRFGGAILGTSASGTIDSGTMSLDTSSDAGSATAKFAPGSSHDFNSAVSKMKSVTLAAQEKQAEDQDHAALTQGISDLSDERGTLHADLVTLKTDSAVLARALIAQQQATPSTSKCVSDDTENSYTDLYNATSDAASTLTDDTSTASSDYAAAQATLQGLYGVPMAEYTSDQADTAGTLEAYVAAANKKIVAASNYADDVDSQSESLDAKVDSTESC